MADPVTMSLMAASTVLGVTGDIMEGNAAAKAGKMKQKQLDRQADAAEARSTRESGEIRRQGRGVMSDAAAAMAGSGGVTDDPGAIQQLTDIQQAVDYNAFSAIYEGGVESQQKRYAGKVAKYEGKSAKQKSRMKAVGTLLSGGAKTYGAYKNG